MKSHLRNNKWKISFIVITSIFLLSSCKNDINNIIKVSEIQKLPELFGEEIYLTQSEYGKTILSVYAKKFIKYDKANIKQTEFPEGIRVVHFSDFPDTLSMISADYAVNFDEKEIWEAKGNVVAKNIKNEVLNTEYLIWDQKKRIIYSNKQVQVTTPNDIIIGEGFESDDQFNNWKIQNVIGVFTLNDDSEDSTVINKK